jgi:hypothetical protein
VIYVDLKYNKRLEQTLAFVMVFAGIILRIKNDSNGLYFRLSPEQNCRELSKNTCQILPLRFRNTRAAQPSVISTKVIGNR